MSSDKDLFVFLRIDATLCLYYLRWESQYEVQMSSDKDLFVFLRTDATLCLNYLRWESQYKVHLSSDKYLLLIILSLPYHPFLLHFMISTVIEIYFNVGGVLGLSYQAFS